ncbi:hypothetical protein DAKH74_047310 [Maudiozyma humilis]|uniref:Uncharacterized protein n=1 Tax=Maudiozyma humilis TaxID=51915 RepID=A0AAV5S347_MAUHU|nr:hypothetical protein DAKH74_047310 [Kazachstania humilis]
MSNEHSNSTAIASEANHTISSSMKSIDAATAASRRTSRVDQYTTKTSLSMKTLVITKTVTDVDTILVTKSSSTYSTTQNSERTITVTTVLTVTVTDVVYETDTENLPPVTVSNTILTVTNPTSHASNSLVTKTLFDTSIFTRTYDATINNDISYVISTETIIFTNVITETIVDIPQESRETLRVTTSQINEGTVDESSKNSISEPTRITTVTVNTGVFQGYANKTTSGSLVGIDGQVRSKIHYSNATISSNSRITGGTVVSNANTTSSFSRSTRTLTRNWNSNADNNNQTSTHNSFTKSSLSNRTISVGEKYTNSAVSHSQDISKSSVSLNAEDNNKNLSGSRSSSVPNDDIDDEIKSVPTNTSTEVKSSFTPDESSAYSSGLARTTATITKANDEDNLTYHGSAASFGINILNIFTPMIFMLV